MDPASGVAEGCFLILILSQRLNGSLTTLERFFIALKTLAGMPFVLSLTILVGLPLSSGSALGRLRDLGGGGARLDERLSPFIFAGGGAGDLATCILGVCVF
jgi:hypothetical protein